MILSRYTVKNISSDSAAVPDESVFELPEKVIQFGTGVLLRGLPDYFIDKANRSGIFNGRIIVVKSTSQGNTSAFDKQDGLYTICARGLQHGERVEENIINSSISRVLNAAEEWEKVLECAHNHDLQVIVSNTTEVGIQLINDDVRHHPPKSFPGKLLAFLYERFKAFNGSEHGGMVIIPTELIPDNGKKLESIVLELAHLNGLEDDFIEWIENHNHFCSSLVDRIVPGKPDEQTLVQLENVLGYSDSLLIMSEIYRLWAIEGDEKVKEVLSFARIDEGVIIEPDINIYRELKLRLLNGTHTLSSGLAFLSGCETVKDAMDDPAVSGYISGLMHQEIAPSIPYNVKPSLAESFGNQVLDRFRNPFIRHAWISITMQYSSKIKLRCVPVLLKHYSDNETVPELMALGFAAYLFFTKPVLEKNGKYYGEFSGSDYLIQDDQAEAFYHRWKRVSGAELVQEALQDAGFWGDDLSELPGFSETVAGYLHRIEKGEIRELIKAALSKKAGAALHSLS